MVQLDFRAYEIVTMRCLAKQISSPRDGDPRTAQCPKVSVLSNTSLPIVAVRGPNTSAFRRNINIKTGGLVATVAETVSIKVDTNPLFVSAYETWRKVQFPRRSLHEDYFERLAFFPYGHHS